MKRTLLFLSEKLFSFFLIRKWKKAFLVFFFPRYLLFVICMKQMLLFFFPSKIYEGNRQTYALFDMIMINCWWHDHANTVVLQFVRKIDHFDWLSSSAFSRTFNQLWENTKESGERFTSRNSIEITHCVKRRLL